MAVIVNRVPMYLVVFSYHLGINYNWSYKILFAWLFWCLLSGFVVVLSNLQVDQGWWLGECHGKFGLFPANYVEVRK